MPSIAATLVQSFLRLAGVKRSLASGESLRHRMMTRRRPDGTPPPAFARRFHIEVRDVEGFAVYVIRPRDGVAIRHIAYFHGGAFIGDMTRMHWRFVGKIAEALDAAVTVPLYPLLPDHGCDDVMRFAGALYSQLNAQEGAGKPILMGDSAGGTIALALAQHARRTGAPQPAGIVLISPFLDLSLSDPGQASIVGMDPLLDVPGLQAVGKWYAGDRDVIDPRVSPLFDTMEGLAPMLLFGGTADILVTDARRLLAKARDARVPIDYHEARGLMHVWPLLPFPEARLATTRICDFVCGLT